MVTTPRSRITPIPLRRVTRRPEIAFTRGELNTERAAWLVFGIGLRALVMLLLTGCGSPVEGMASLRRVVEELGPRCDYEGPYSYTFTPIDPGCGQLRAGAIDEGPNEGACSWRVNGQPGHVDCPEGEHPVERCEGETRDDAGCWYAVDYWRVP